MADGKRKVSAARRRALRKFGEALEAAQPRVLPRRRLTFEECGLLRRAFEARVAKLELAAEGCGATRFVMDLPEVKAMADLFEELTGHSLMGR